jgi:methionyl-tRNA formyltransferase
MRRVFLGTPEVAAVALKALLEAGHDIAAVYSQPPRPAGRGYAEKRSAVHELALEQGIAVRTPASLKTSDEQDAFRALGADAAVVAAYGLLLPRPVLEGPTHGCSTCSLAVAALAGGGPDPAGDHGG